MNNVSRLNLWTTRWCDPKLSDHERLHLAEEIDNKLEEFDPAISMTVMYHVIRQFPQYWQHLVWKYMLSPP